MNIHEKTLELLANNRRFALACVISATGSTPQKAGATALFEAAGPVWGTLGGGCLEAESRRRALDALDTGQAFVFDVRLDDIEGWDDGLICGGKVQILVQPAAEGNAAAYRAALDAQHDRGHGALVSVVRHPESPVGLARWFERGELAKGAFGLGGVSFTSVLASGRAALVNDDDGGTSLFVEPVVPAPRLLVVGAGHIGKAVARMAAPLGFEVTVVDDRPDFASRENLPGAHTVVCGDIVEEIARFPIAEDTYVLIVTRGHRHDGQALAACVQSPAAFIGMIGSRRKALLIREQIVTEGIATAEQVARVVSPVGLDIGSETVEEIALSIVAQLVAHRRRAALGAAALNHAPAQRGATC